MLALDNDFWDFSVTLYSAPGVAEECLALQDSYGIDINVLLFCAWIGYSRRISLKPKDIDAIDAIVRPWHESAVKPLRSARRFMKSMLNDEASELRHRVKACELVAEQVEQAMLYAYAEYEFDRDGKVPLPSIICSNLEVFLNAQVYSREPPIAKSLKCLLKAILDIGCLP